MTELHDYDKELTIKFTILRTYKATAKQSAGKVASIRTGLNGLIFMTKKKKKLFIRGFITGNCH